MQLYYVKLHITLHLYHHNEKLFVLWIIGFIGAIQGEEKKAPLLGDMFQEWFKGV